MSELLRQLDILTFLALRTRGTSVAELAEHVGVSEPTIKRDVDYLRHLGADIVADRAAGYRLMNWPAIRDTARKWRKLERERATMLYRGLVK